MIYTNYFYSSKLEKGEYRVRDNRFYPGKAFEVFALWFDYVRIHYPNEHILIFDNDSTIPIEDGMNTVKEDYEIVDYNSFAVDKNKLVHVVKHPRLPYLDAVARNIYSGIEWAYRTNDNLFWLDTDFLINNNLSNLIGNLDVWSDNLDETQMTMGMVCLYVSKSQLHKFDGKIDYLDGLKRVLDAAGYHGRMATFFEHGMYDLFCFGDYGTSNKFNGTHMSCYKNFLRFLNGNPIDSPNYTKVKNLLEGIDFELFKKTKFQDTRHFNEYYGTEVLLEFGDTFYIA